MILFRRLLPFFSTVAVFAVLELLLAYQRGYWLSLALVLVIAVVPVGMIVQWRFADRDFWYFVLAPVCLVASTIFLLLFLSDRALAHALLAGSSLLFGWYVENLFLFHFHQDQYQPYALEHIMLYVNLLSVFFFFSSLFAARIFLNFSAFMQIGFALALTMFFSIQILWSIKHEQRRSWALIFVMMLVLMEFFGVASILPTTFFVAGFLVAIPYYLMTNVMRHSLRATLTRGVVLRNAIIGGLAFVVTLAVAPWT